jgi:hypothetical protein
VSEQEFVLTIIGMVGTFGLVFAFGRALFTWLRERHVAPAGTREMLDVREQLSQLQTSVDAMAVELERISEGQRFATRLLAERPEAHRLSGGEPER